MRKGLDKLIVKLCEGFIFLTVKLCEGLPRDFTLYEREGFCKESNEYCKYCKKIYDDTYFCNKKTYISNLNLVSKSAYLVTM